MWSSLAGFRTLKGYSAISVAWITSPLGSMNRLLDGSPVRWLGSSSVPTPDVAPLSAIVDGIVLSIIPWRSSSLSTPSMYFLSAWGIVVSTVLAKLSCSRRHSNLPFLFRLRVSAMGVTLLLQNVNRRSGSCSSTWHGGGDKQE